LKNPGHPGYDYATASKDGKYSISQERFNGISYWSSDYGTTYGSSGVIPPNINPNVGPALNPPEQFDGSSNWTRIYESDTQLSIPFSSYCSDGSQYANSNFVFKNLTTNPDGSIILGISNADSKLYITYVELIGNGYLEDSVSTTSGAVVYSGGMGIAKSIYGGMTGTFDTVIARSNLYSANANITGDALLEKCSITGTYKVEEVSSYDICQK
jgi:hypothetical protein